MNNIDILEEKEKKAIEYIKNCLDDEYDFKNATRQKDKKAYNIILNLIEKQSKEIEQLNKSDASKEQSSMNYYNLYKELADKIKAKIEIRKEEKENCKDSIEEKYLLREIYVLQSLLGKE